MVAWLVVTHTFAAVMPRDRGDFHIAMNVAHCRRCGRSVPPNYRLECLCENCYADAIQHAIWREPRRRSNRIARWKSATTAAVANRRKSLSRVHAAGEARKSACAFCVDSPAGSVRLWIGRI